MASANISDVTSTRLVSVHEQTQVIEETASKSPKAVLHLRLKNPVKSERKVNWAQNTIDNEYLNKKKSKCCCVFEKARNWNESSSEDENEDKDCKNCRGHRITDFNKHKSHGNDDDNSKNDENCLN